jgi:hypothetical protein
LRKLVVGKPESTCVQSDTLPATGSLTKSGSMYTGNRKPRVVSAGRTVIVLPDTETGTVATFAATPGPVWDENAGAPLGAVVLPG